MAGPEPEQLDALVIGAGQGGTPLAQWLAEAGHRTALVERDRVGGTCVLRGCTPSKTMIASARISHLVRRAGEYGVRAGPAAVDLRAVRDRKRSIVDEWSDAIRSRLEAHEGVELIEGEARFTGERTVEVRLNAGGARTIRAERIFIDTGGRPAVPPVPGLTDVSYLDSTTVMELDEVPRHLLVLGGGFVGLEFAQMYRRFGAGVTILEQGPRIAAPEDEDVSSELRRILEGEGIAVRTSSRVEAVEAEGGEIVLRLAAGADPPVVRGSHLLVAVGRAPNTEALALEATGIRTDDRGHIPVNGRRETSVPGIWALGDVTGAPPFTHFSYDDARIIRANLLDGGSRDASDRLMVYTVFTDPQLGRVGVTEREARESGREVRVAKLPMRRVARAIETDETRGFMKAVVDAKTDRILGAAILGIEGGEIASLLQVAMLGDLPYTALRDATLSHPTLAESLNNLFASLEG